MNKSFGPKPRLSSKPNIGRRRAGEPFVWLSGGATAIGVAMIIGLVGLIFVEGFASFWPRQIEVFAIGAENPAKGEEGHKEYTLIRDGKSLNAAEFFDNPEFANKQIVVGSEWASSPIDPGTLPLNSENREPWSRDEITDAENLYVRIGNSGTGLVLPSELEVKEKDRYSTTLIDGRPFLALKAGLPDIEHIEKLRPNAYKEAIIGRQSADEWTATIDRQTDSSAIGHIVALHKDGKPIATLEDDGIEAVWNAFDEHLDEAQELLEHRREYEESQGKALAVYGQELSERILELRHKHRASAEALSVIGRFNFLFDSWKNQQPNREEGQSDSDYQALLANWLWDTSRNGKPTFEFSDSADAEDHIDESIGHFEKAPESGGERQSFRGIEAIVLAELADAIEATGTQAYAEEHKEDFAEIRELFARKALLHATLQIPMDTKVRALKDAEATYTYSLQTFEGKRGLFLLSHVVRAFRPNHLGFFGKAGVFTSRLWEFVAGEERLKNEVEGSVNKIILGTMLMTILMAIAVVPFGVITALYLREYAKQGPLVSTVRVAVNNLAGVPSIVFGIFGFGFFSIVVGGSIDDWLYPHRLPNPTFGGGGILWASLTLALLTVPVVIVATEEALASVPSAQREASLACGASRFQTIMRVVLPQATPGILTGMILAMARGAGEVAPLMLVGVVPSAETFPIDGFAPFFHLERKFEHLGFHIYDLKFQYSDPDYAKPFVFASAMILLTVVAVLNLFAIRVRTKLRRKFKTSHV